MDIKPVNILMTERYINDLDEVFNKNYFSKIIKIYL